MADPAHQPDRDAAAQLRMFRQAAALLASTLELDQTLANTIACCLPALGDFGFFDVVLDDATVRRTARAYQDPDLEAVLASTRSIRSGRTDINLCALSCGSSAYHPDIDDAWYRKVADEGDLTALRALALRSMICVPLRFGGTVVGSLTLFMARSGRRHSTDDLALAEQIADLAAPIVFNVRLLDRQRRAEAEQRANEERLRLATDAGGIGIWEWAVDRDHVTWSERVYALHGVDPGQFDGTSGNFTRLVHPDDRAALWRQLELALADGSEFVAEFRPLRPDGEARWLATRARVFRDGCTRVVGATIDITAQKQAQLALERNNERLQARAELSETARDRIWRLSQDILAIATFDGHMRAVNPALGTTLGWTEEDVLTMSLPDFVHPEQREEVMDKLAQAAQGVHVQRFDLRVRHQNGSYRWLSCTAAGENGLLFASAHDVTEVRRLRELQLNASEVRLQLALEVGGMGAWEWDLANNRIRWWPGMDALHGLAKGAQIERLDQYLDLVYPEDRERLSTDIGGAMSGSKGYRVEYRVVWPDHTVHWIEGRADFMLDNAGMSIGLSGVCVDITHRKRTEQDLRFVADVSKALSSIVDHQRTLDQLARLAVPAFADWCAVDLLNDDGELERLAVAHADPARLQQSLDLARRHPPDPQRRGGVWDVIRSGQSQFVQHLTPELLAQAVPQPAHDVAARPPGLRSYICVPLKARGQTLGAITFVSAENQRVYNGDDVHLAEDIGRRAGIAIDNAALYRSLKHADKRKDEFLAMLAHELRNPLAPIRAAAELMKISRDPTVIDRTSSVIARQVDHMTGLVDDLLDVSRVTRGLVVLERRPVALDAVAAAAVEQVRPLIDAKQHRLVVEPGTGAAATEAPLVEGDEKRLTQVLANLLNNAAKYTPSGGQITLRVEALPTQVVVTVRDSGIGMDRTLVGTAFELFAQGERSSDRSQGGLGIGLALVKSLVELHGGRVRAASAGLGQGSEFSVRLPRLVMPARPVVDAGAAPVAPAPPRRHRVLVVDDNTDAADLLGMVVGAAGHAVQVCHGALAALEAASETIFDDCILDIGLPDMDGNELARRIRTLRAPAPQIIAVTGYGQAHDRALASAAGFDHYLVKPVNMAALLALLAGA